MAVTCIVFCIHRLFLPSKININTIITIIEKEVKLIIKEYNEDITLCACKSTQPFQLPSAHNQEYDS